MLSIFPGMQTHSLILRDFGLLKNALFTEKHVYFQIFHHDTSSLQHCSGTAVFLCALPVRAASERRHTDTALKQHQLLSFFPSPRVTGPERPPLVLTGSLGKKAGSRFSFGPLLTTTAGLPEIWTGDPYKTESGR